MEAEKVNKMDLITREIQTQKIQTYVDKMTNVTTEEYKKQKTLKLENQRDGPIFGRKSYTQKKFSCFETRIKI